MLIDDLIGQPKILVDGGVDCDKLSDRLRSSHKFVLGKEFAAAVNTYSTEKLDNVIKIMPFCRSPFPSLWIELLYDDRQYFDKPDGVMKAKPLRIGWLVEATNEKADSFNIHMAWSFPHGNVPALYKGLAYGRHFNVSALRVEVSSHELMEFETFSSEFHQRKDDLKRKLEYLTGFEDWQGELTYVMTAIAMLNARNLVEYEEIEFERRNRKAVAKGKRPLASHKVVMLRLGHATPTSSGDNSYDRAAMRGHFVRGHFKVRRSGIYWWSTFARGDFSKGHIDKDYQVVGGLPSVEGN